MSLEDPVAESTTLTPEQRTEVLRESGRMGGYGRAAVLSPEERKAISRKAYLAGAVNAVVARAPELTPEQAAKLAAIFAPSGAAA